MQPGLSIVITSLVMLMHDEVARLRQVGINTCFYNRLMSDEERKFVLHNLEQNECQYEFVFASLEGLFTESCLKCLKKISELDRLQCFIVDEAHCISTWGKDFRKDYARLGELKKMFNVPIIALTGTATKVATEIIRTQLLLTEPVIVKLPCRCNNLAYKVINKPESKQTEFIVDYIYEHYSDGCGIVYCGTQSFYVKMAFKGKDGF